MLKKWGPNFLFFKICLGSSPTLPHFLHQLQTSITQSFIKLECFLISSILISKIVCSFVHLSQFIFTRETGDRRYETQDMRHETVNSRQETGDMRPSIHETGDMRQETRDTRHETRDTRHETRDTRHETRDTRHETRDTRHET